MKKCLFSLLAILLAVGMLFSFAGCGKDEATDEPTTAEVPAVQVPTSEATEPLTVDAAAPQAGMSEATTEEATTEAAAEAADTGAPPANLGTLSQEEQLAYFNKAVNRVRAEKPGYVRTEQLKIADMNFTGVVKAVQGIINGVAQDLMPGDLVTKTVAKGANNQDDTAFLSKNANASELRTQDINSIKSTKSGDNWNIEVSVKNATNPAKGTGSTVSRIADMQTREEILDSIMGSNSLISADYNKATVTYKAIYAKITVNAQGQVIEASNGFDVTADAKDVKISFLKTNATFLQTSRWTYKSFNW